jgi:cellulose synthase/poly-beta-1,6-N-acetylglucosamine synthase-like glycosyltransferase
VLILIANRRLFSQKILGKDLAGISVIIAAKNEASNLQTLISSLEELDYPENCYEIIIIDDESNDNSFELCSKLIEGKKNFKIYTAVNKKFPAKRGALAFGIERSSFENIMITDADCMPQEGWLSAFASMFNMGYDFLIGIAPFKEAKNFINKISRFENFLTSLLTTTAAHLGLAYSSAARNFGFKKSAFEKISGYSNTLDTLSGDDDLLLREAVKNNLRIGVVTEKDSFVYSQTKDNLKDYLNQRSRHIKTSLYYLPKQKAMLGLCHGVNLIMLFSPLLAVINPIFVTPFFIKLFFDTLSSSLIQNKFEYKFKLFEMMYLQIFYEFLLLINFLNALFHKDVWR